MSTQRDIRLSPQQLAFKLACRQAVQAAGGQVFVAGEVGRAQSRISDWVSENTAEFMPLDIVAQVEALGAGSPGHPHVTRALARAAGERVRGGAALTPGLDDLGDHLAALAREHADLLQVLACEDLERCCSDLSTSARATIAREAGELAAQLEQLRAALGEGGNTS